MWIWRRMLRVSWTEKRTNEHILEEIGHETLRQRAARQKTMYFGHVMRADGLEKEMTPGLLKEFLERDNALNASLFPKGLVNYSQWPFLDIFNCTRIAQPLISFKKP